MARTISASVDERVARRVERLARLEDRPISQVAGAALRLYTVLPREAHASLRHISVLGGEEAVTRVGREIARVLLDGEFELVKQRVVSTSQTGELDDMDEEALLDEAVRMTTGGARTRG